MCVSVSYCVTFRRVGSSGDKQPEVEVSHARFLKLKLSRESRVIPGTRNSSILATANLGLSSE